MAHNSNANHNPELTALLKAQALIGEKIKRLQDERDTEHRLGPPNACPACRAKPPYTTVLETRTTPGQIRRRRVCKACGARWKTKEIKCIR